MKRLLMVLAVLTMGATLASAVTVTCDAPPNPNVPTAVDSSTTVLCGGLVFDQFNVVNAGGVPNPVVNLVSATFLNGVAYLNFNPNLSVTAGNVVDIQLFFRVTGGIEQIDLGVGPSRAAITEAVCTGSFANGICSGNLLTDVTVYSNTPSQPIWSSPFAPTSPVYVFKDINVDGRESAIFGAAGNGGLSSFTQSFHTVPEPLSFLLIGSGLLAMAGFRKLRG